METAARAPVQPDGQLPVDHRQAVAGLEGPWTWISSGTRDARGPVDDPAQKRPASNSRTLLDPRRTAGSIETLTQARIGPDRLHRRRHHGRVLGMQQDAGPAHRLGNRGRAVRDHRHPGGHRLENRHTESLVLAHRDEDAGAGERRPEDACRTPFPSMITWSVTPSRSASALTTATYVSTGVSPISTSRASGSKVLA